MRTYNVKATRWLVGGGWQLEVDGVGVWQTPRASSAEATVRSYLTAKGRKDAATAEVKIDYVLPEPIARQLYGAVVAKQAFEAARTRVAEEQREAVRMMEAAGLSRADIAVIMRLSTQRISQIADEAKRQPVGVS